MLPAGSSTGSRHRPRDSFQSSVRKSLKLLRKSDSNDSYGFLRSEGLPVSVEPPLTRASSSGNRPSKDARRTFIQRTMALFRRQQPRQAPKRQLSPLLPRVYLSRPDTLRRTGRDGPSSLTRLVLPSTDDVSFSSSSFFRRVEEISTLNANRSSAPPLPSTTLPLRPPPRPPRRRPPPPVDEGSFLTTTPPSARAPTKAQQKIPRKSVKTDLDSALELQASAATPNNLDPLDSPPLAQQRLYASPSIKSRRASLPTWPASASQSAAPESAPGSDPLSELLAVSDELKAMRNFDSDDILYLTDVPLPLPSLPPTLHAFLDAPSTSLHILEMEIHRESETFLGVPIPCIVVTSESDPLPPMDVLATPAAVPLPAAPGSGHARTASFHVPLAHRRGPITCSHRLRPGTGLPARICVSLRGRRRRRGRRERFPFLGPRYLCQFELVLGSSESRGFAFSKRLVHEAGPPDNAETRTTPKAAPTLATSPCPGWWWGQERYITNGEGQVVVRSLLQAEKEAHLQGIDWTTTSTVADDI
ncbi:hypothetical protein EDB86DRAFT_3007729, partial [Lactarius hatsudake]